MGMSAWKLFFEDEMSPNVIKMLKESDVCDFEVGHYQ